MKEIVKAFDNLPFIVKLLLCIPAVNIAWQVYKICRSLSKNNVLGVILGILCIVPGATFMWLIDLITLLVSGKSVWWLD